MVSGDLDELLLQMRAEQASEDREQHGPAGRAFWTAVNTKLLPICERRVGSVNAPDLLQRSVIAVMKKLPRYEKRVPDGFSRWLQTIVKFEALQLRREIAQHERKRGSEALAIVQAMAGAATSPSTFVFKGEQLQAIEEAKKQLTPLQRESLDYPDTHALARAKNILVETARRQRRRAVARLIELLRQQTTWRVRIPT